MTLRVRQAGLFPIDPEIQQQRTEATTKKFLAMIPPALKGTETLAEPLLPLPKVADVAAPPVPVPMVSAGSLQLNPLDTLTECLDTAECPATARRIYRLLFRIGLTVLRQRGLHEQHATQVSFHLPLDLIAAHLEVNRSTVWRNLRPLEKVGVLHQRDHYGTLRGQTAVTGKVWALSLRPHEVLAGTREPVKVRHDDLIGVRWRDLDADARKGRTAWAELERVKAGKAAEAEMLSQGQLFQLQQSQEAERAVVSEKTLLAWALAPFLPDSPGVTLTDAFAFFGGLDTVYAVPALIGLPKAERSAAVSECARQLAATFGDTGNQRFWCWLLWQMLRLRDQGQDVSEDIAGVLARVFQDLKTYPAKKAAAVVVSELIGAGLYDRLRLAGNHRVGGPPPAA
ncbi:hypothetical protein GCM10017783_21480 [Deinococcus piscis]|uniref:Uncharacterized protein n=1 Tax=Deinococcus piscis TaxID=394230 RepID=A0ABQ3KBW3_9DEIO|nr:hypothetical protein [Deinococcus piscis]GHG08627.1 hypothetical protein GCM10017783_21480 [Deinococcus piscis]